MQIALSPANRRRKAGSENPTSRHGEPVIAGEAHLALASDAWSLTEASRENLSSHVQRRVREALMSARFHPGEKLNIREMATMLGTSATPVREALARLAAEGAIEMRAGHSARVPVISPERYAELCEVRKCVEGFAAEVAATRISQAGLVELRRVLLKYDQACANAQSDRMLNFNLQFRFGVYRAAAMPTLERIIEGLWLQSAPMFRLLSPINDPVLGETYRRVIKALAARDPAGARAALQDAISLGSSRLLEYLETQAANPARSSPKRSAI